MIGATILKKCDKCGELRETSGFTLNAGRWTSQNLCIELDLCKDCTKSEVKFLKERFSGKMKK